MAETIPGGAFLTANDQWVDANGKPLTREQIAEAKRLDTQRNAELRAAELRKLEAEAKRDPTARALAAALRPDPAPAPKGGKAKDDE